MAELLQPPDTPLSADPPPISSSAASLAPPPPLPPPPPPENLTSAAPHPVTSTSNLTPAPGVAPKRQRRPSVRLGEIGDQSYDHQPQPPPPPPPPRRPKTWRFHKEPSLAAKTSKTRPLTNLVNGGARRDHIMSYGYDFGSKKPKSKKPTKRLRSNWSSSSSAAKFDSSANGMLENDAVFRDENLDNHISKDDDVRDELEAEQEEEEEEEEEDEGASESPLKEQMSPLHSMDNQNMGLQFWDRRAAMRARQETNLNNNNKESNFDDAMNGINNEINSGDGNRRGSGVRDWLIGLGLGRYAPVFEIHEVDDEVLPMLTLEDLKDMGINAVGSRRKMYSAILKLRKGFS